MIAPIADALAAGAAARFTNFGVSIIKPVQLALEHAWLPYVAGPHILSGPAIVSLTAEFQTNDNVPTMEGHRA